MEQIGEELSKFIGVVVEWLPLLLGSLLILIVGWFVARLVKSLVYKGLRSVNFNDKVYSAIHGGASIQKTIPDVSVLVSNISFWVVMFGVISLAVSVLGIDALNEVVGAIYSYIPNIIAAILIFVIASTIVAFTIQLVDQTIGDTPTGRLIKTVVPFVVLGIATFMILVQLQISPMIVTITYAAIMGSAALGLALAFGLGGRDVASRMLETAYQKGKNITEYTKKDVESMKMGVEGKAKKYK